MGYFMTIAPCVGCGTLFSFNPDLVPSIRWMACGSPSAARASSAGKPIGAPTRSRRKHSSPAPMIRLLSGWRTVIKLRVEAQRLLRRRDRVAAPRVIGRAAQRDAIGAARQPRHRRATGQSRPLRSGCSRS
jgi:hypothetical protein